MPAKKPQKEQLVFDFTSTFKATTKAGRTMKKSKGTKPVLSSQRKKDGADDEEQLPEDATDDINRDLEDDNFLPDDALDASKDPEVLEKLIPRNLQITQEEMAKRKVMDIRRWFCMARP